VQKNKFNFAGIKTIVYSSQSRYWQGFADNQPKINTGKGFSEI
jgi:hypothetical protein